jgi:hypothetical protein
MERHLSTDDPRLANTLTRRGRGPVTRYVVAGIGSVVGLLLLVLGAHDSQAWLGSLGFVLMFGAVAYAFAKPGRREGIGAPKASAGPAPAAARRKSFMDRLEARWDRRREQGDR